MSSSNPATELVSIDNFHEHPNEQINSPRTLEACLRCGVDTAELYPQPIDAFKANNREVFALTKIKFDHCEEKRQGAFRCGWLSSVLAAFPLMFYAV